MNEGNVEHFGLNRRSNHKEKKRSYIREIPLLKLTE